MRRAGFVHLTLRLGCLVVLWASGSAAQAGRLRALATGDAVSCAITTNLNLWCWGRNNAGQLGDGTTTDRNWPVKVGASFMVSTRDENVCALPFSGVAVCAGDNTFGQLGDGTNVSRSRFARVGMRSASNVNWVTAGRTPCHHYPGINCWGWNQFGAVGDGSAIDRSWPVSLPGFPNSIYTYGSGGDGRNCTVNRAQWNDSQGELWCWGNNQGDLLGVGTATASPPVLVASLGSTVAHEQEAVGVGVRHMCAIAGGKLWCWGANDHGQLGDGTTTFRAAPVEITGPWGGVVGVAVSPNGDFTCARERGGRAFCWGRNDRGQLGDGTTVERHAPTVVSGLQQVREIDTGRDHACAWAEQPGGAFGGEPWCWGDNQHGQVGDGTNTARNTPIRILLAAPPPVPVPAGDTAAAHWLAVGLILVAVASLGRRALAAGR